MDLAEPSPAIISITFNTIRIPLVTFLGSKIGVTVSVGNYHHLYF